MARPYRSCGAPASPQPTAGGVGGRGARAGARHRPVLPARAVRDLAARAPGLGRPVLVVRRRLRARRRAAVRATDPGDRADAALRGPPADRRRARPASPRCGATSPGPTTCRPTATSSASCRATSSTPSRAAATSSSSRRSPSTSCPVASCPGVLAHELSHHLGMHTVGLTIGHWLSLPVVLLARVGFWLQNVATAATDTFAKGSAALTFVGQLVAGLLNVAVAAVRRRPLRRRRPRQRRRPPLRVPGRPPRRAHGLRPQPGRRPAAGHRPRRRPPPRRLARPPRRLHPPARTRVARIDAMLRHPTDPSRSRHRLSAVCDSCAAAGSASSGHADQVGPGATPRSRPRRPPLT